MNIYANDIAEFKKDAKEIETEFNDNSIYQAEVQYGYFCFTEMGKLFLKTCIDDIEEV